MSVAERLRECLERALANPELAATHEIEHIPAD